MSYISASLRKTVEERAQHKCEYCLMHEDYTYFTHEIDHIYAEKHGGETNKDNLCLACADCNRYKGSDICSLDAETNTVVTLFHPRKHLWSDHFLLQKTGFISAKSAEGRITIRLLRINRLEMIDERFRLINLGKYDSIN